MTEELLQAPFPYFGGKRNAASIVWDAFGDPGGYVEPFAGSLAVLLRRPKVSGRRVETVNDLDGWLVNVWRALQHDPAGVARHADWPVTEIDYHARLAWLQERRTPELISWLEGDPECFDVKAAGWWLYVAACGIGNPWGAGPWRVMNGYLVKVNAGQGVNRGLPHLGDAGKGVNRKLPHLGDAGQGLYAYFARLQQRLRNVRITCGDWQRVLKPSVVRATTGKSGTAIFLDPPYTTSADLYAAVDKNTNISAEVEEWCQAQTGLRIALCGYNDEHDALLEHGWTVEAGKAGGGRGYSADSKAGRRERIWFSPECESGKLF